MQKKELLCILINWSAFKNIAPPHVTAQPGQAKPDESIYQRLNDCLWVGWSSLKGAVNVVMHKVSTTWVLTNSLKSLKTNTLVHWTRCILAKNVWLRRSWRAIFQRRHRGGKKRYNGALARLCLLRALVQCEILQMVHLDFFVSSSSSS